MNCKQVDVHVYAPTDEEYERVYKDFDFDGKPADGETHGIPYGCLVPKGSRNLWVAGRCISTDIKVNGAIRDQPACVMLGQAAGTAAVQAIRLKEAACELNTDSLVKTLQEQGCNLPQTVTSRSMTRS